MQTVVDLLCEMIAIDSQSSVSNVPLANFMQSQLEHWDIERIDYVDREGIAKQTSSPLTPKAHHPSPLPGISIRSRLPAGTRTHFEPRSRKTGWPGFGRAATKGP